MDFLDSLNSPHFIDGAMVFFVFLSAAVGWSRGLLKETLGLVSWLGAIILGLKFYTVGAPYLQPYAPKPWMADVGGGLVIFGIALILFLSFSKLLSKVVEESILSVIDRTLGVLFGIVRGVILEGFLVVFFSLLLKPAAWPIGIQQAHLIPWALWVGEELVDAIPKDLWPSTLALPTPPVPVSVDTLSVMVPALSQNTSSLSIKSKV